MQTATPRHFVYNSYAAADAVLANQIFAMQGEINVRLLDVVPNSVRKLAAVVSETLGVVTVTPTGTFLNSAYYSFSLTQQFPAAQGVNAKTVTKTYTILTPSTGTITATTISDQFKNEYLSRETTLLFTTNATGAGTVVITAVAGNPLITGKYNQSVTSGTTMTVVQTTPGVALVGTPALMQALGVSSALTTGTAYTMYRFLSYDNIGEINSLRANQHDEVFIWLNQGDADLAATVAVIDEHFKAYTAGSTTVVDPEFLGTF